MSKRAKEKARLERRKKKAAKKAQMKAKYEAWRDAGVNKKSKRNRLSNARASKLRVHRVKQRLPFPYHLWRNKDGSYKTGMPHWAWLQRPEAQSA